MGLVRGWGGLWKHRCSWQQFGKEKTEFRQIVIPSESLAYVCLTCGNNDVSGNLKLNPTLFSEVLFVCEYVCRNSTFPSELIYPDRSPTKVAADGTLVKSVALFSSVSGIHLSSNEGSSTFMSLSSPLHDI